MPTKEIFRSDSKHSIFVDSKYYIRRRMDRFFTDMRFWLVLLMPLSIVAPILWAGFFLYVLSRYFQIYDRYFTKKYFSSTIKRFKKLAADKDNLNVFSIFGYEIENEEFADHEKRLSDFSLPESVDDVGKLQDALDHKRDGVNELAEMGKLVKKKRPHTEFGLSKDVLLRHIIFSGTTGSGKTETLFSIMGDVIRPINPLDGTGASGMTLMLDGKSDFKMLQTYFNLCKQNNAETGIKIINFMASEKQPETNTYSPVFSLPPVKAIDFLSSLLPEVDPQGQYFRDRGVAMLTPSMTFLNIRNNYHNEPSSLSALKDMPTPQNYAMLFGLMYGIVREENERIKAMLDTDKKFSLFFERIKDSVVVVDIDMEYYETILNYVLMVSPQDKTMIEEKLGYEFSYFRNNYIKSYSSLKGYMSEVYDPWLSMATVYAKFMYHYFRSRGQNFVYNKPQSVHIRDVRRFLSIVTEDESMIETVAAQDEELASKVDEMKQAMGHPVGGEMPAESLLKLPETPLVQHAYARQQWTSLFDLFLEFPHVFGSPNPDVVMRDVMMDNQNLYILLPVLSLSADKAEKIGKMFIRDIQIAAGESLGGDRMDLTAEQANVLKDKATPKPLNEAIFDEVGAYITEGLSVILSQTRGINLGVILSGQDMASYEPKTGAGKREQQRLLANSAKYILKTFDTETKEWAEKFIAKQSYEHQSYAKDEHGNNVALDSSAIEVKEDSALDPSILSTMTYGCGVWISEGTPTIVQSYYVGGKQTDTYITNTQPIST